jgi:hypothetical protein
MDMNDITIEDIRILRPDLYDEITKEAIQASQVISDEEVEEIVKPLFEDLKEETNHRFALLEKKLQQIVNNRMKDVLSVLKEKYESKKKVSKKPSKPLVITPQRNALIGEYLRWRPTGEIGKVVRFELDGNVRKIVLRVNSKEYIKVYDNRKMYDVIVER